MLLHEAVRKARKDAGLSQQKLADAAGIQRRQLATLEQGGNVTLATVRKVLSQLPNLASFTLDTVKVDVSETSGRGLAYDLFCRSVEAAGISLQHMAARMRGGEPTHAEMAELKKMTYLLADTVEWGAGIKPPEPEPGSEAELETEAVDAEAEAELQAEAEPGSTSES